LKDLKNDTNLHTPSNKNTKNLGQETYNKKLDSKFSIDNERFSSRNRALEIILIMLDVTIL